MASQVFYRKWRPQTLAEVVGQEQVTQTLLNASKMVVYLMLTFFVVHEEQVRPAPGASWLKPWTALLTARVNHVILALCARQ